PACTGDNAKFDLDRPPTLAGWGMTTANTRHVSQDVAGLAAQDVPTLRLKWAFAFHGASRARSQPTLAGGAVFVGSQAGTVYALDLATGCVRWSFQADAEVRSAPAIESWRPGDEEARPRLFFGDLNGAVYGLEALTGQLLWKVAANDHPRTTITGSPRVFEGRVYVPLSSTEWASAADPAYECCTFRGGVTALNAADGSLLWRSYTITEEPALTGTRNSAGALRRGPAGAPVWNSPAIDPERGQLYVGTGENYSSPATSTSDAIFAIALLSGAVRWVYQATANDAWNSACVRQERHNCPAEDGPDYDFGAAMVLARTSKGGDVLLGPQKAGVIHAVDPDDGTLLWRTKGGRGGL
ncbi:MAG: PQQ-binding-like beta-propeller repeat protein, partial [Candidatus Nanopelagicales bacterium]